MKGTQELLLNSISKRKEESLTKTIRLSSYTGLVVPLEPGTIRCQTAEESSKRGGHRGRNFLVSLWPQSRGRGRKPFISTIVKKSPIMKKSNVTVKKPRKRRPWKSVTDQMENWFPCTICNIHTKLGRNQHIRYKHQHALCDKCES